MNIKEFSVNANRAAAELEAFAERRPDMEIFRNSVGNFAIMDAGNEIGWIDFKNGTLEIW